MSENLKLSKPIHSINGETIEELHFDFDAMCVRDYRKIVSLEGRLKGESPNFSFDASMMSKKASSEFRMATAFIAALKGTQGLCLDDIDNLAIVDLLSLEELGAFFMAGLE